MLPLSRQEERLEFGFRHAPQKWLLSDLLQLLLKAQRLLTQKLLLGRVDRYLRAAWVDQSWCCYHFKRRLGHSFERNNFVSVVKPVHPMCHFPPTAEGGIWNVCFEPQLDRTLTPTPIPNCLLSGSAKLTSTPPPSKLGARSNVMVKLKSSPALTISSPLTAADS